MSDTQIHPTAIIAPNAVISDGVVVEPYAIIKDHVEIGENSVIGPHAVIHDYVRMGSGNRIHAHAVIGDLAQDISFDPAMETWVEIGDGNTIREGVTIHRATNPGTPTRVGSNCFLMAYAHIGHDCQLGDGVIFASYSALGGHTEIGDNVVLGAAVAIHQFCRIGSYTMLAGFMGVRKDVLPYTMIAGDPARHYRLNTVGLRRAGVKGARYKALEAAYRAVRSGDKSLQEIESTPEVEHLREWLSAKSKRGLSGFLSDKNK